MSHADANGARVAAHSRGENRYRGLKNGSTASNPQPLRGLKNGSTASIPSLCVSLKWLCSLKLQSSMGLTPFTL